MTSSVLTRAGAEVFNPTDSGGNPRGADMSEAQTWATEIERVLHITPPDTNNAQSQFSTKSSLEATAFSVPPAGVYLLGYTTIADGGGGPYKLVTSEPSHTGKIQSGDGSWYENAAMVINPNMFGGNFQNMLDMPGNLIREWVGNYSTDTGFVFSQAGILRGAGGDYNEAGIGKSQLSSAAPDIDILTFTGDSADNIICENFGVHGDGGQSRDSTGTGRGIVVGGGGVETLTASMAVGSDRLVDNAGTPFLPSDVGKKVSVVAAGSGGSTLLTKIAEHISAGEVRLASANASGNIVSNTKAYWVFQPVNVTFGGVTTNAIHKIGLHVENGLSINVKGNCEIRGREHGCKRENLIHVDEGDDSYSAGAQFFVSGATGTALEVSCGGPKLIGLKTLGGLHGIVADMNLSSATANIIIIGNSSEDHSGAAYVVEGNTHTERIVLSGNSVLAGQFCHIKGAAGSRPNMLNIINNTGALLAASPAVKLDGGNNVILAFNNLSGGGISTVGAEIASGVTGIAFGNRFNDMVGDKYSNNSSQFLIHDEKVFLNDVVGMSNVSVNYHGLHDPSGTVVAQLGNSTDPRNYFNNTFHRFGSRNGGSDIYAEFSASYFDLKKPMHMQLGSASVTANPNFDDVIFENSAAAGMSFLVGTNQQFGIAFGDSNNALNYTIQGSGSSDFGIYRLGQKAVGIDTGRNLVPGTDNGVSLGNGSERWAQVFAANGTINTSDERLKDISGDELSDQEMDAWSRVNWQSYRWLDAVEQKGDDARLHMGLIAQQVEKAFSDVGLDAFKYSLLCVDDVTKDVEIEVKIEHQKTEPVSRVVEEIEMRDGKAVLVEKTVTADEPLFEEIPVRDEGGKPVFQSGTKLPLMHSVPVMETNKEARIEQVPDGNRYGLRYVECLAFEAAYQRRLLGKLEARMSALEKV